MVSQPDGYVGSRLVRGGRMTELKLCPFCGCEVEIVIGIYGLHSIPNRYNIIHPENDCIMEGFESYFTDNKEYLIEDWNRRVEE